MVGAPGAPGSVMGPLAEGDPGRIGPYTTLGRLGVGALGPLYGARSDDGRAVAVRALRPDLLAEETVKTQLAADIAAARTVPGRYAAPVLGADLDAETPWLASEYVAGVPLAKAVADHGPLPESALLTLAAGLAEALAALHAAGVMHGDLRPGTVLLTPDGPRVVDYALVRAFEGAAEGAVEVGVAGFLAPEQALGRTVTSSADMFALGSTLFFATMGRAPFGEGRADEVKKRVAKSSPVLGKLPSALAELIRGCFQKDPNSRAQPQQVVEYVRQRAPIPPGGEWLPPAVAADVRAAVAEGLGSGSAGGAAFGAGEDANATIVVAPALVAPAGIAPAGIAPAGVAPAAPTSGAPAPGGQIPGYGATQTGAMAAYGAAPADAPSVGQQPDAGAAGYGAAPTGPQPIQQTVMRQPDAAAFPPPAVAPIRPTSPTTSPDPSPAPSRRNLLLALGGAVVVLGGGTAVAIGRGGSSGTTVADEPSPPVTTSPAAGVGAPSTANSAPAPSLRPLPPNGPLASPVGAAGSLQGPDAAPFWQMPGIGEVFSLAVGEDMLVVSAESGVSGYDLGFNPKWGPVPVAGVPRSGNGVVAGGVVYLIAASEGGAPTADLLAVDVKTGAQRWRAPMPQSDWQNVRVGGVLNTMVFVVGTAGPVPFLWAVDAGSGRGLWQRTGMEFATVALPSNGSQILAAGAPDPDGAGTYLVLDTAAGDQLWTHPLKTAVDYGHVSLSKAAFAGGHYVLLLAGEQVGGGGGPSGDTLVGGSTTGGQPTWTTLLPEPDGDAGSLALITRSPDANSVVALSRRGVYAVDALSGRLLWQSQGTESFNIASDAGAPQFADGNVYLYDQRGSWWAVDVATGRTRWTYSVTGFDQGADPVWLAVPGGVVVAAGTTLTMIGAGG